MISIDSLKDFRDTLYERAKSPFIGSYFITWSIINWQIYVLLFYNENSITIKHRLCLVRHFLCEKTFCDLFLIPACITLGILLLYAILNGVALFIRLLYENWLSPYIHRFLNNKSIIEKSKYEALRIELSDLRKEYEEEKDLYLTSKNKIETIQTQFDGYKRDSISTANLSLTAIFNPAVLWLNTFNIPKKGTGQEKFRSNDRDEMMLENGKRLSVSNIKRSFDGKIIMFDKLIDGRLVNNYLIRNEQGDYYGIEDDTIIISYTKIDPTKANISETLFK